MVEPIICAVCGVDIKKEGCFPVNIRNFTQLACSRCVLLRCLYELHPEEFKEGWRDKLPKSVVEYILEKDTFEGDRK